MILNLGYVFASLTVTVFDDVGSATFVKAEAPKMLAGGGFDDST